MNQSPPTKIGRTMITSTWILLLILLTVLFGNYLEYQDNPNRHHVTGVENQGNRQIELQRNRYGHYVATGQINGITTTFLLDTGATDISIPASIARTLGVKKGFASQVQTANGIITVYSTRLQEVRLGNIVLHDVSAHINPNMHSGKVLLGMSFLKELEFTQQGKILTITQP